MQKSFSVISTTHFMISTTIVCIRLNYAANNAGILARLFLK